MASFTIGHRLELACGTGKLDELAQLRRAAPDL